MGATQATTTIDKAGRVVVPKVLRDALHLKAGDELEIAQEGESLVLRQPRPKGVMKRKNGIWVYDAGEGVLTNEMVNEALEEGRREGEQRALGE